LLISDRTVAPLVGAVIRTRGLGPRVGLRR
jgi:hypothetical protein